MPNRGRNANSKRLGPAESCTVLLLSVPVGTQAPGDCVAPVGVVSRKRAAARGPLTDSDYPRAHNYKRARSAARAIVWRVLHAPRGRASETVTRSALLKPAQS